MNEIRLQLFKLLDEVDPTVGWVVSILPGSIISDPNEILKLAKVRHFLTTFVEEFLTQFFYAYGFAVKGFNPVTIEQLKVKLDRKWHRHRPSKMIRLVETYVKLRSDSGDPYSRMSTDMRELYCDFLPRLFETFRSEGAGQIANYDDVTNQSKLVLSRIRQKCQDIGA